MFGEIIRGYLWGLYLRMRGARVGKNFRVREGIDLLIRDGGSLKSLSIGNDVSIGGRVYLRFRRNGSIKIGNNVKIGTGVWLVVANDAQLDVGDNTGIGSYGIYNAGYGIKIGRNCLFAGFVYLNSSNHRIDRNRLINEQGHFGAQISIGDDVWLTGHVVVNSGVKIDDGAVVGSSSVVTKDIDKYGVAIGAPAKIRRYRI